MDFFVEGNADGTARPFLGHAATGMVDEDSSNLDGGEGEETSTVPAMEAGEIGEAGVGFIGQGGGLEGVIDALAFHVRRGEFAEFFVHAVAPGVGGTTRWRRGAFGAGGPVGR